MPSVAPKPAFGEADLSNCEREQIHLAGSIQPHGALLVLGEPDLTIVQASANASAFLAYPRGLIGCSAAELGGTLAEKIEPYFRAPPHDIPIPVRCRVGSSPEAFDCLLHRPPAGGLVVELERAGPGVDLSRHLADALQTIVACPTLRTLCDETARIFKNVTGYDRVMVYRFDEAGHGEVFAEQRRADLEAFLGNRYPASDIPQMARRLYEKNRVRVLADVEYKAVALTPRLSPISGRDLDMSLCFLRSMSPIHIQYLKNMGVGATLVVSLVVGGKLWGLVACHHYQARFVHFEVRAVVELIAEAVATRIAALDSFVRAQAELSVRRLEQRMIETIGRDGDWRTALFDSSSALLQPVAANGAALLFDGQILTAGDVPATPQLREIGAWLDGKLRFQVFATDTLPADNEDFAALASVGAGLMATPVSRTPGEYLLWFRPEQVQTVTWGGNPFKPFVVGNDASDLSPRRSFAQWHQQVEGTSEPWTGADLAAARLIGESVADVVVQSRSVRILIAQDQLETISRDVRASGHPAVIADAEGRILLVNEAFECLLRSGHRHVEWLDELPRFFDQPEVMRERLRSLVEVRQGWRGECSVQTESGAKPLHVRADPILAAPHRLLGFVLLFTDTTERRAAETARRRFQEGTIERPRVPVGHLDPTTEGLYRGLLGSVLENAQLAALEITDGLDTARMPDMLESVRASVMRSAEVLEHLIHHAAADAGGTDSLPGSHRAVRRPAQAKRGAHPTNGKRPPPQPPRS